MLKCAFLASPAYAAEPAIQYHVAVDGDDSGPGTHEHPFATLARARDAVRDRRQASDTPAPATVTVGAGKYFLDDTLVLTNEDSGTRDAPIRYESAAGERVVISGGIPVTGWERHEGEILKAPLPPGDWHVGRTRQMTLNGRLQTRARFPNFDADVNPLIGAYIDIEDAAEPNSDTAFRYTDGALPRAWSKPHLAETMVTVAGGWSTSVVPIESIDRDANVIRLAHRTWHGEDDNFIRYRLMPFRPRGERDAPFYVDNVLEELDIPGEWCFDPEIGVVYFWPPDPLEDDDQVVLPRLGQLVELRGVSHVTFSGFTFTETTSGDNYHREGLDGYGAQFPIKGWDYCGEGVRLTSASFCTVERSRFEILGGNGVYIDGDCLKNAIERNTFEYIGANGIAILGTVDAHPLANRIVNNSLSKTGWILHYTAGIFAGLSNATLIAHNEIVDVPHHGVNLATNGHGRNVLEYNIIRRTCLVLHDNGAVNMWMDPYDVVDGNMIYVQNRTDRAGHILRYNLITDSVQGFYLDDWASNCVIYGNIFSHVWNGVTIHGGKNNLVENNIYYDTACMVYVANDLLHRPAQSARDMFAFCVGNRARNNIVQTGKGNLWWLYTGEREYDTLKDRRIAESEGNVFWTSHGNYGIGETWHDRPTETFQLDEWRRRGYDRTSIVADPLLVDPENEDFSLRPESPAFALGFQPIDQSRIGIQPEKPAQ